MQVLKGTYKRDVGYVVAVENWGGLSLLLVPHLPGPHNPDSSLSKRKHSCLTTPPEPNLFSPIDATLNFGIDPVCQEPYVYHFNRYTFEHRLILKTFVLHSVSSTSVHIPTQLLFLFWSTDHPAVMRGLLF